MSIWSKVFIRRNWENKPSRKTPINDINLNAGDYALDQIDDRVVQLRDMIHELEGYQVEAAEAVNLAHKWAQWTDGTAPSETDNSKYWAQVARDAAELAVVNLGQAGYLGFQINEYGHLIMTKSVMLDHLDFNLDPTHKDLVVTVNEVGLVNADTTGY